jgi:hypothetical protein
LPFWEPAKLKALTARMMTLMQESIERAESSGAHDLPLQEAALESSNMVGKCCSLFQNLSVLQHILTAK